MVSKKPKFSLPAFAYGLIFLLAFMTSYASGIPGQVGSTFDTVNANKILDNLSLRLTTEKLNIRNIRESERILTELQIAANKCVNETQTQIIELNKQLQASQVGIVGGKLKPTADQTFLKNKTNETAARLSACRLFVFRSTEVINEYNLKIQKLVTSELFRADDNIFTNIISSPEAAVKTYTKLDSNEFFNELGSSVYTMLNIILFLAIIAAAFLAGFYFKALLLRYIDKVHESGKALSHFGISFLTIFPKYVVLTTVSLILFILVTAVDTSVHYLPFLTWLIYGLFTYLVLAIIIDFSCVPIAHQKPWLKLPESTQHILAKRLKILVTLIIIMLATPHLLDGQMVAPALSQLGQTIFITILAVNLIGVFWLITRIPKHVYRFYNLRVSICVFIIFLLNIIILAEWFGYHNFALYLLRGLIISICGGGLLAVVLKFGNVLIDLLRHDKQPWQRKVHQALGIKPYESFSELFWLRLVIFALAWTAFSLLLLKAWGLKDSNYSLLVNALENGFIVTGLNIIPSRIIVGVLLFIALVVSTRLIKTHIVKSSRNTMEQGAREAIASIIGYAGFALAVIFGLLIAGVNFAGLAIIAGALSVGIGFGLQNIVNNFLSGLILLIERPIKPGDRIIVGDTEGYVKKISIRSTQIKTLNRADVLVPNSELISKQVTNLTFQDYHFKVRVDVGVAYSSDTDLVKNLLLKAAHLHPDIVKEGEDAPKVTFKSFGESTLNFELSCVVIDVNNKGQTQSDLNFIVNRLFQENKVNIAFPQREITVKNWPKSENT